MLADLGTAAWDEPQTVEQGKARMGGLPRGLDPNHLRFDTSRPSLTDRQRTDLREFFEDLPDMEPIDSRTRAEATSALIELQRLRVQARRA